MAVCEAVVGPDLEAPLIAVVFATVVAAAGVGFGGRMVEAASLVAAAGLGGVEGDAIRFITGDTALDEAVLAGAACGAPRLSFGPGWGALWPNV